MANKNDLFDFDETTASNNDNIQGANIAENCAPSGINNAIRGLASIVKRALGSQGSAITSSATTNIGAAGTALYTTITGTTSITSFGTVGAGTFRIVEFAGALTLTHNATSLKLPGSANIATAAGDVGYFISLGSGNWKCLHYNRASGAPVTTIGTASLIDNAVTYAKMQDLSAASHLLGRGSASAGDPQEIALGTGLSMSGTTLSAESSVLQVTIDISQSLIQDTNNIPFDSSAPLSTEGTQAFSRSFTPLIASSTIIIEVDLQLGGTWSTGTEAIAAIFKGTTCVATGWNEGTATNGDRISFKWSEAAGSTAARTYSVRFGATTGTTFLNRGNPTSNSLGGTPVSSMKIMEIT